ncbi:hypothetical protein Tco_1117280 [Tanacetum coccineum]
MSQYALARNTRLTDGEGRGGEGVDGDRVAVMLVFSVWICGREGGQRLLIFEVRVASAVEEVVWWWCRCDGGSGVGPRWRRVAASGVDEGGVRVEPR